MSDFRSRAPTLILTLSTLLIGTFYLAYWIEGWVGAFLFLLVLMFGLILLALLATSLFWIAKSGNKRLMPSFIFGIIAGAMVIFRPVERILDMYKSPIVLAGYCEHTVTTVSFAFRKNGQFEYNAGAFLSSEIHHGTYDIKNDTIYLHFRDPAPDNVNPILVLQNQVFVELGDTTQHRHYFVID